MKIEIVRSGGFAGMTRRQAIDTATLPPGEAARIEALARAAEGETASAAAPSFDAFTYEVTIDGRRHTVGEARGAWETLIEALR